MKKTKIKSQKITNEKVKNSQGNGKIKNKTVDIITSVIVDKNDFKAVDAQSFTTTYEKSKSPRVLNGLAIQINNPTNSSIEKKTHTLNIELEVVDKDWNENDDSVTIFFYNSNKNDALKKFIESFAIPFLEKHGHTVIPKKEEIKPNVPDETEDGDVVGISWLQ